MKHKSVFLGLSSVFATFFWIVAVFAGTGPWRFVMQLPAPDAKTKIERPFFSATDSERRRYYVVDSENSRLVSFDREGKFLAAFNAGGRLKKPVAMARDVRGNIWVVERSVNQLLYVSFKEKKVRNFTLTYPDGGIIFADRPAVDLQGRLFLLDRLRGAVLQLDDNLQVVKTLAGNAPGFTGFGDYKIKSDGLWALDGLARKVYHFDAGGVLTKVVQLSPGLQFPVALEIDPAGQFYILDRHAGTIAVYDREGKFKFDFLTKGKRRGQLWYAGQLLFDWEGRLCVVNEGNGRVDIYGR
jgi:streptogramin lyase